MKQRPDICFCAIEAFAVKIGLQLKKTGLRIPEDIPLIGLDDRLCNECFSPPITAIRQDSGLIAEVVAESLHGSSPMRKNPIQPENKKLKLPT